MVFNPPATTNISQVMNSYCPEIKNQFFPDNNNTLFFRELGSNIDRQAAADTDGTCKDGTAVMGSVISSRFLEAVAAARIIFRRAYLQQPRV